MKKIITIFLFFIAAVCNATTYYISTAGNDITGNGSIGNPWRTLYKATSSVSGAGDIIHIVAGTYDETQECHLAVGVSIEGEGPANRGDTNNIPTSILRGTAITANFTPIISANSAEGTNGNQHISNIKMEGQLSTYWGANISGRSNFTIYDCYIVGFLDRGIIMHGRNDFTAAAPTTYASGISFHHNTIRDCSRFITDGTGCFNIGGTVDAEIAHNYMEQLNRASGYIGWPIKLENSGYNKGLLIDSNVVIKSPWTGTYGGEFGWNFCAELWNCQGGMHIWGNYFQGSLDLVHVAKFGYSYGTWIHDNIVNQPTLNNRTEDAFFFEKGGSDILIEHNTVNNTAHGVVIECEFFGVGDPDSVNIVSNVTVRNNLFKNLGVNIGDGNSGYGFYLDGGMNPQLAIVYVNNIEIYNNTYIAASGNAPFFCFGFNTNVSPGTIDTVKIYNNIVQGFHGAYLIAGSRTATCDKLYIKNNLLYLNANSNDIWPGFSAPTNYVNTGNILGTTPNLDGSYHPNTGSAAIDAGTYAGISFNGSAPDIGFFETGSADLTPPTVTATNPTSSAIGVLTSSTITITFDGTMDASTLTASNIYITGKPGTVTYGSNYAIITPLTRLSALTTYTVNVENVKDASGNTIASPYTFTFTTGIDERVKRKWK